MKPFLPILFAGCLAASACAGTPPPPASADPAVVSQAAGILARADAAIKARPKASSVKQAALEWMAMETRRLIDEASQPGRGASAGRSLELADETLRAAADPAEPAKNIEPPELFPAVRAVESNPGAKGLFDIGKYKDVTPRNPKKSGRNPGLDDSDCLHLAYAALHPQSPARGNPQAIISLLTALNHPFAIRTSDTWSEQDAIMGYILLNAVYPDLVPHSVRRAWEQVMRARCDKQIATYSPLLDRNYVSRSWLNGDIRNFIQAGFCGLALRDESYRKWMKTALDHVLLTLQPDGANNYTGYQNEAGLYHDAAVQVLAWYWVFSRDPVAFDFVAKAARFYPLTAHRFICEEYTAPEQKHYYNGNLAGKAYAGCFAADPFAIAACQWTTSHLGAFFFDPTMPIAQPPDRYTIFDRNIIGPRGRYGNLDFAISTRDFSYYPGKTHPVSRTPEKGFGVTTFLGMRVMNPPGLKGWPMNGVVERVMNRARIGKQEHDKGELIESSVSMAGAAAAVSADYMTSGRQGQNWNWGPVPFSNTQAWIINGERAVGFMRIAATESVADARMSTMFEFVSGRGRWGVRKELVTREKWSHEYGDLRLRVIETSYKDFEVAYTKGGLSGNDNMRALFRLVEEPGKQETPRAYGKGDSNWCLVELRPAWSAPSESIRLLDAGPGLSAFACTASGKSFALVHNSTDSARTAVLTMPPGYSRYSLHLGTDSKVDRDKFLNLKQWERQRTRDSGNRTSKLATARVDFSVPPKRNILLPRSNEPAHHENGMQVYEDVFSSAGKHSPPR